MRIDLRQNILDYQGRALPGQDGKPEVVRNIFATALNTIVEGEVLTPEIKSRAYDLTTKIYARKQIELTLDERVLIKDRVALLYGPLVFGRISDILEQNDEREKPLSADQFIDAPDKDTKPPKTRAAKAPDAPAPEPSPDGKPKE